MVTGFDVETEAMEPLVAPPLVCGAFATDTETLLLDKKQTIDAFREALRGEIAGCNLVFDLGVMVVQEPRLLPLVFQVLDEGRAHSIDIDEQLHDIGRGCLFHKPEEPEREGEEADDEEDEEEEKEKKRQGFYSLVALERRYLGIDRSDEKEDGYRLRYHELKDLPLAEWPPEAGEYPKRDAVSPRLIHLAQANHLNREARPEEMRAAWALHLMKCWGIRTDRSHVTNVTKVVTKLHDEMIAKFTAHGIYRGPGQINPKSKTGRSHPPSQWGTLNTKRLQELVSDAYGGNPPRTDTGNISRDRDTLSESRNTILIELGQTGENEKLYSQYLDVLAQGVERPIHASYRVLVRTGRTSCARPNLQNLPRDERIRNSVVPRSGNVFIDCDYPAQEFCTLAQELLDLYGRSSMADALRRNLDPHLMFAAEIAGAPYAPTAELYGAGDKPTKNRRSLGKEYNYGKGGGMGPATLVRTARKRGARFCVLAGRDTECRGERITWYRNREIKPTCIECLRVAEHLDSLYLKLWPEMREYFALIGEETSRPGAQVKGYLITRGGCTFTSGANFRFQHRAAVASKRALVMVTKEGMTDRRSPLWGFRPAIMPHDQLLVEGPEVRAPEAAERVAELMRLAMEQVCPDVPCRPQPALTRRWRKDAPSLRDSTGRLQVYGD